MKNLFFFIPALLLIILLSNKIDSYGQKFLNQKPGANLNNHIFYKTFGEFCDYLSDLSYLQADAYFHAKGQTCRQENCLEQHPAQARNDQHQDSITHSIKKTPVNPLLNIAQALKIGAHRHLSSKEEKELIPWFYYAIKLNPQNEQAYYLGGFWLATRLDKIDEAIRLLEDGIKNNPNSWKIYAQLGEIYIMQKKDYVNAAYNFEQAKGFAEQQNITKFEKRVIYTFLAESYKKLGKTEQAQKLEMELDKLFTPINPNNN